ncbi:MAG: hypothetical protein GY788_20950 [bacterium]|nr:hypothetical protein [bacterium]
MSASRFPDLTPQELRGVLDTCRAEYLEWWYATGQHQGRLAMSERTDRARVLELERLVRELEQEVRDLGRVVKTCQVAVLWTMHKAAGTTHPNDDSGWDALMDEV